LCISLISMLLGCSERQDSRNSLSGILSPAFGDMRHVDFVLAVKMDPERGTC